MSHCTDTEQQTFTIIESCGFGPDIANKFVFNNELNSEHRIRVWGSGKHKTIAVRCAGVERLGEFCRPGKAEAMKRLDIWHPVVPYTIVGSLIDADTYCSLCGEHIYHVSRVGTAWCTDRGHIVCKTCVKHYDIDSERLIKPFTFKYGEWPRGRTVYFDQRIGNFGHEHLEELPDLALGDDWID